MALDRLLTYIDGKIPRNEKEKAMRSLRGGKMNRYETKWTLIFLLPLLIGAFVWGSLGSCKAVQANTQAITVWTQIVEVYPEMKQFKSMREAKGFVQGLDSFKWVYSDYGKVCRHFAGARYRAMTEAGYFAGIVWINNHWEAFTFVSNRAVQIDNYGNVKPMMGWEDFTFDW